MPDQEEIKDELDQQLRKVKYRLEILDRIDERLFEMKRLAEKIIEEDLTDTEIEKINKKVKHLQEQVVLLDLPNNEIS